MTSEEINRYPKEKNRKRFGKAKRKIRKVEKKASRPRILHHTLQIFCNFSANFLQIFWDWRKAAQRCLSVCATAGLPFSGVSL